MDEVYVSSYSRWGSFNIHIDCLKGILVEDKLHDFTHRFTKIAGNLEGNWEDFKEIFTEFVIYVEEYEDFRRRKTETGGSDVTSNTMDTNELGRDCSSTVVD